SSTVLHQPNHTTTDLTQANHYLTHIHQFTHHFPELPEEPLKNTAKKPQLTNHLQSFKATMQPFNQVKPPQIPEDLHPH
ncbi:DUF6376 family protein, partial [Bacillus pumilus]|uniref:DUF6376 family protein n=1 Tax=Bacillus pumilus TaxID=1408 RepID=UPI001C92DF18